MHGTKQFNTIYKILFCISQALLLLSTLTITLFILTLYINFIKYYKIPSKILFISILLAVTQFITSITGLVALSTKRKRYTFIYVCLTLLLINIKLMLIVFINNTSYTNINTLQVENKNELEKKLKCKFGCDINLVEPCNECVNILIQIADGLKVKGERIIILMCGVMSFGVAVMMLLRLKHRRPRRSFRNSIRSK